MKRPSSAGQLPLRRIPGHPTAYWGFGALSALHDLLGDLQARRVLVIHGRRSFRASGASATVAGLARDFELHYFDRVSSNPALAQVLDAVETIQALDPDVVVGIGGGSVLDSAKAAVFLASQSDKCSEPLAIAKATVQPRNRRLVLAPTTAGSGSELTRFATVYVEGRKRSLENDHMIADAVLVDPDLAISMTAAEAAPSALDALSHAIESYWSSSSTPDSRAIATSAAAHVASGLGQALALKDWSDPRVRRDLAWGSTLAGSAIDLTRTTAAHALSYWLTAYRQLPHGVAVALHLPWLMDHHLAATEENTQHPEGAGFVRSRVAEIGSVVLQRSGLDVETLTTSILRSIGQPGQLSELHLPDADQLALFSEFASSPRARNNPCLVTLSDVRHRFARKGAPVR